MRVCIDPGHGAKDNTRYWVRRACLSCGTDFSVRRCYAKRGQGKFCSTSCATTHRNLHNNPTKSAEVRKKISANHADVSGKNNPMFGKKGQDAPGYIDGRRIGEAGQRLKDSAWRVVAFRHKERRCELCGSEPAGRRLHVHHIDGDRMNNHLENLIVVCVECHNTVLHERLRDDKGRYVS